MTEKLNQSHDTFFKQAMTRKIVAREFFEMHLPPDILKRVSLDSMKLEKASFLDNTIKSGTCDMPRDLWSLYHDPELAKVLFTEPFPLIEVQKLDDKKLLEKIYAGIMAFTMKHINDEEIIGALRLAQKILQEIAKNDYLYLEDISWYIVKRADSTNADAAFELLKEIVPDETRGGFMKISEAFIRKGKLEGPHKGELKGKLEGLHEGELKGKLEGLHEGELKGRRTMALSMLSNGLSLDLIARITGFSETEIRALEQEAKKLKH